MSCCRICGDISGLYASDGDRLVCRPCVASMGRIVAEPSSAHMKVLGRMAGAHWDVVHLEQVPDRDGVPTLAWRWNSLWPSDHTLLRSGSHDWTWRG